MFRILNLEFPWIFISFRFHLSTHSHILTFRGPGWNFKKMGTIKTHFIAANSDFDSYFSLPVALPLPPTVPLSLPLQSLQKPNLPLIKPSSNLVESSSRFGLEDLLKGFSGFLSSLCCRCSTSWVSPKNAPLLFISC